MNNDPILILQMQRMGDLVLSFPLLESLRRLFPLNPLIVMGEKSFYEPLQSIAPHAEYLDFRNDAAMLTGKFHAVINLSHRKEAAAIAGRVQCDTIIGPRLDAEGRLFIHGDWQLYRTSLTLNNHYNLFHWTDLNCLDIIPGQLMAQYKWVLPKNLSRLSAPRRARVGLFIGASETAKHPSADFWAELANHLLHAGLRPALLGGRAEAQMGAAVAKKLNAPALNLCGNFNIDSFTHFIRELALLVVPDTGPMHVATRVGTPVLNLSLGPVNPWETGPSSPGHHIVRAKLPCVGCWECTKDRFECHDALHPESIGSIIRHLLSGSASHWPSIDIEGEPELLRSSRTSTGLYNLLSLGTSPDYGGKETPDSPGVESPAARHALSRFWQMWFGSLFGLFADDRKKSAWAKLNSGYPNTAGNLRSAAAGLALSLAHSRKKNPAVLLQDTEFWKLSAPIVHPLSGYIQMYAQNTLGSREAMARVLSFAEMLAEEE